MEEKVREEGSPSSPEYDEYLLGLYVTNGRTDGLNVLGPFVLKLPQSVSLH